MVDRSVFDRRLEVDHGRLFDIMTTDLPEIEAYVAAVTRFVFHLED